MTSLEQALNLEPNAGGAIAASLRKSVAAGLADQQTMPPVTADAELQQPQPEAASTEYQQPAEAATQAAVEVSTPVDVAPQPAAPEKALVQRSTNAIAQQTPAPQVQPPAQPQQQQAVDDNTRQVQPTINYSRIHDLLSSRHSISMYDRHEAVLRKLIGIFQKTPYAVHEDFHALIVTWSLACARLADGGEKASVLLDPVLQLLRIAVEPLSTPEDVADLCKEHVDSFAILFDTVGQSLACGVESLSEGVLETLLPLLDAEIQTEYRPEETEEGDSETHHSVRPYLTGASQYPPTVLSVGLDPWIRIPSRVLRIIEQTSFTENILAAFQDGTTSAEIRYECLRTVKQLLDSNRCFKTIAADTTFCASLVEYLAQPTLLDAPRELAMEVLWQLVEAPTSAETLLPQLMTTEAVTQLHACMQFLLRSSQKAACRQMRNDLVMLLTVLIERHPEITSPSWTALNDELFEVMRSPEQGRTEHGVYSLTHSAEDLEFKKSLLQHFAVIAARSEDVEFKREFIEFMGSYLTFQSPSKFISGWPKRALKTIQLQILGILHALLPSCIDNLQTESLTTHIGFLRQCLLHDTGILYDGSNVDSEPVGLVQATLSLLLVISEQGATYKTAFAESGALGLMLEILNDKTHNPAVHASALLVCSSICHDNKKHKREFFNNNGVQVLAPFLKFDSPEPKENSRVLLATLECVWECVVGFTPNENAFLEKGGIFLILDLLERSSEQTVKRHVLGTLLELLESPKSRSHALEWRMNGNQNMAIGNLLVDLWCQEERALGVSAEPAGTLAVTATPLRGSKQERVHPSLTSDKSRAIQELDENLRAKIYGTICKLGIDDVRKSLDARGQIKLQLIQKFLDFKIGEIWIEIKDELAFEGVQPVTADEECIEAALQSTERKACEVRSKQDELARLKEEAERAEERNFYKLFLDSKRNEGINASLATLDKKKKRAQVTTGVN